MCPVLPPYPHTCTRSAAQSTNTYRSHPFTLYKHTRNLHLPIAVQPETRKSFVGLLPCSHQFKLISGHVHVACSGLMITSLLQVVNMLDASCIVMTFIHQLDASIFLQQSCKYQVSASLIFTDFIQLDDKLASDLKNKQIVSSLWCFWLFCDFRTELKSDFNDSSENPLCPTLRYLLTTNIIP